MFDNESLEFLGDAVLGFVIADMLFREFPAAQRRAEVEDQGVARVDGVAGAAGERLDLGEYLILGRGEEKTGGRRKQALLADGYEALIAAIYLDGGIEPARAFIEREFAALIDEARRTGARRGVHRGLQVGAAGVAAVARPRAAGVPAGRRRSAPITASVSRSRSWWTARRSRAPRARARRRRSRKRRRLALEIG